MRPQWLTIFVVLATVSLVRGEDPEKRALAFLIREVPAWSPENQCYSCHNNGDGARALYTAHRLGFKIPAEALADTTAWLLRPHTWDKNGGDGPFSDKKQARIQFAATLVEAGDVGLVKDEHALRKAAELVAEYQEKDGAWQVEASGSLGSPTTYGAALATYYAARTLRKADAKHYETALTRAEKWFRALPVKTVPDAVGVLFALDGAEDTEAKSQRERCLTLLRKGQTRDGGWGPFTTSPPEVFDTALATLALSRFPKEAELAAMTKRGRAFLLAEQQKDGGWPETTRPSGSESYAQRISTTSWALRALLATRDR